MELGNMAFGNSRGEYEIDRGGPIERSLLRLGLVLGEGWYCSEFKNQIFEVFPYYWGDCDCGWDAIDNGHRAIEAEEHLPSCIHVKYEKIQDRIRRMKFADSDARYKKEREWIRLAYELHGIPTTGKTWWHGCAVKCTCDYHERLDAIYQRYAAEFGHKGCLPTCSLVRPNFIHKASGIAIQWYKYPLRDAYSNVLLDPKAFDDVISDCIQSVGHNP